MTAQRRDRVALVTGAARNACDESAFAAQPPLGRLLAPSEVAEVIAFSAVDGASGVAGAVLAVDGGLTL